MAHRVWATAQYQGGVDVQIGPNGQDYAELNPLVPTTFVPAAGDTIHIKLTDSLAEGATSSDPTLPAQGQTGTGHNYAFLKSAQGQSTVNIAEQSGT